MSKEYVEKRDGGFWVSGQRISLDSIVYAWQRGASPESIQKSFPLLTLEEVYGAIAFYLANKSEIDAYLIESEKVSETEAEQRRLEWKRSNPELWERLQKAKKEAKIPV